MKGSATQRVIALIAAAIIVAAGFGAAWLAGTTEGARWFMDAVSRHTPLAVSARTVEGRFWDRLRLGGVRLALPPLEVEIDSLDCRWQPLLLLSGRIAAEELSLTGVQIRDNTPEGTPPDLAWPRISGMAAFFGGAVERLQVNGLTYRRLGGEPLSVTAVSSALSWRNALLSLSGLVAASPAGGAAGSIEAGFGHPSLRFDLLVTPARPAAGMDAFSLQGLWRPGKGFEQMTGGFTVAAYAGKEKRLEVTGEAGMTRHAFNLRQVRLSRPGRRGEITGGGTITPTAQETLLAFQLQVVGVDLTPELNTPTDLFGTLALAGTPERYRGEFNIANRGKGWRAASLSGSFQGGSRGARAEPVSGSLLAGSVQGSLDLGWGEEVSLKGAIRGRNLNPAGIAPDWAGVVNFDLEGDIVWPGPAPLRGKVSGRLLESRLHGQALTGEVRADFAGDRLHVDRLALRGRGFDITAAGDLDRRLTFAAQVGDLSRLVPETAGELRAAGWVSWRDGRLEGAVTGRGGNLAAGGFTLAAANLTAQLGDGKGSPLHVAAKLHKAAYGRFQADAATIEADGTALRHTVHAALSSPGAEAQIAFSGGYRRGSWQGEIVRFSGRDSVGPWSLAAPAALHVAARRITLSSLILTGVQAERIEVSGDLTREPPGGAVRVAWNDLNLARTKPWLPDEVRLEGALSGRIAGEILPGERLDFTGKASLARGKMRWQTGDEALDATLHTAELSVGWQGALPGAAPKSGAGRLVVAGRTEAAGVLTVDKRRIHLERIALSVEGNDRGMKANMDLSLAGGGTVNGRFSSPRPAGLALPAEGDLDLEWAGFDLFLVRPWLPRAASLEGRLSGRATGTVLPGKRFSLKGDAALSGGKAGWRTPEGEINVNGRNGRSAAVSWDWQGETLRGGLTLALAEYGQLRGNFQLPLPASFPLSINRKSLLQASLTGQLLEKGLLASFFPGVVQESRGEIDADLRLGGTWDEPNIEGSLKLAKAGAYLPTAGIHLRDVQLAMRLEKDLIRIDSLRAVSGAGHIEGSALVRLTGWQVVGYRGSVNGERFQTVFLPELQILSSPRLTFEGTPKTLIVRGEVRLPEMLIFGPPTQAVVQPSRDVILEGAPNPAEKAFPLTPDVQVRIVLGEKVLVKMEGIDAQLDGGTDLMFKSRDKITSKGEIKVVKGRYKAYGVDLEIVRGRLFYAGGSIDQPTLDILALRTVGDVRAGITVGGILSSPVIKLYSEPAMPATDILAYIVFGNPFANNSTSDQAAMMARVATSLLSPGQASSLQDQIKNRLGISTLEIQTSSTEPAGRMGYKEVGVTPTGAKPASQVSGTSDSVLTLGKYLIPQLYFSYGRSLFTGGNQFRLRYDFFKQWQIETQTGSESSLDLYYKIDLH